MFDFYDDEIQLEYNNFLAEQELFDNLIFLGSSVQHEGTRLLLIQEDYKNSVNKYIDKIVTGIQQAWENFKNKVVESPMKKILERIKGKINSYDGNTEVQYWHTYDTTKFEALKMVNFNLDLIKSCGDKITYYEKVYPGFMVNKDKSLKENIIDQIINTQDTHVITKDEMVAMYDFFVNQFSAATKKLEDDLKRLNTNINTLKSSINVTAPGAQITTTVTQQTTVTTGAEANSESYLPIDTLTAIHESILLEDKEDTKSTTVVKDDENKENGGEQKNNIKYMNWYLAGNTDVFSSKMKILRQRFLDYIRIFKAVFPAIKRAGATDILVLILFTFNLVVFLKEA